MKVTQMSIVILRVKPRLKVHLYIYEYGTSLGMDVKTFVASERKKKERVPSIPFSKEAAAGRLSRSCSPKPVYPAHKTTLHQEIRRSGNRTNSNKTNLRLKCNSSSSSSSSSSF